MCKGRQAATATQDSPANTWLHGSQMDGLSHNFLSQRRMKIMNIPENRSQRCVGDLRIRAGFKGKEKGC